MKTLEQILLDNPPFYASKIAGDERIHWMFMLEDGRLIELPGKNHAKLLGVTADDGDPQAIEQSFCEQNKALRIAFEAFRELDARPGDYRCVYVQIFGLLPNEAQWAALGELYRIRGRNETICRWDVYSAKNKKWARGQGSLSDLRRQIVPLPPTPKTTKRRRRSKLPLTVQ
jgi:hypothetical protein